MAPLLVLLLALSQASLRDPGKRFRRPRRRFRPPPIGGCWHHPVMHTAGIDLGGTKVQGVIVGDDGAKLGEARGKTPTEGGPAAGGAEITQGGEGGTPPTGGGPAAVVAEITKVVKAAAKDAKVQVSKLAGVGIGSPGRVDQETGELFGAATLPGFGQPVPLGELVASALGVKRAVVDNDVAVATLAEHRLGAGRGFDDLLVVFAGSGVGGGLVLGGQLRAGPHGAAGEIGHMVVVDGGELCPCGRRGCIEAYAGRVALERAARAAAANGRRTELLGIQQRQGACRTSR